MAKTMRAFFCCEYYQYSRSVRQFSFTTDGRKHIFEASIVSPDKPVHEDELYRLFDGHGVEIADNGSVVRCCGDLAFVLSHLKAWLKSISPDHVWVSDVGESFNGYQYLQVSYPLHDIRSIAVYKNVGFRSAYDRAAEISLTQAGLSPRRGAYLAEFLINKIESYEKNSH
jgi:hypothetical protein